MEEISKEATPSDEELQSGSKCWEGEQVFSSDKTPDSSSFPKGQSKTRTHTNNAKYNQWVIFVNYEMIINTEEKVMKLKGYVERTQRFAEVGGRNGGDVNTIWMCEIPRKN